MIDDVTQPAFNPLDLKLIVRHGTQSQQSPGLASHPHISTARLHKTVGPVSEAGLLLVNTSVAADISDESVGLIIDADGFVILCGEPPALTVVSHECPRLNVFRAGDERRGTMLAYGLGYAVALYLPQVSLAVSERRRCFMVIDGGRDMPGHVIQAVCPRVKHERAAGCPADDVAPAVKLHLPYDLRTDVCSVARPRLYLPELIAVVAAETVPRRDPDEALTVLDDAGDDPVGQPGMDVVGGCALRIGAYHVQAEHY